MISYTCDGCGLGLKKHGLRYVVSIDARAAYDEMEVGLAELVQDHRKEMLDLIEKMKEKSPKEIEQEIYQSAKLDLCPRCYRTYMRDPLHFHPDKESGEGAMDIDSFLRSLGYGESRDED